MVKRRLSWLTLALLGFAACGPTRSEGTDVGDCTDGADNDGDGDFDCNDTGCAGHPSCIAGADGGPRDAGAVDAGPSADDAGPDAGPPSPTGECGDVTLSAFGGTVSGVEVRTTVASNTIATCGGIAAPGNEAFVAFDLRAGDVWHFHVAPDPSAPGSNERDPFVYLLTDVCDPRDCDHSSEQCDGPGDEHFTFVAPSDGRYYLGVDDRVAGGGDYLLEAVRVVCGNGTREHGEACDDALGGCTAECRAILDAGGLSAEIEPNDNAVEANEIEGIGAAGTQLLTGALGGELCGYPDVFTLLVEENRDLAVSSNSVSSGPCASAVETPFEYTLRDATGAVLAPPMLDANGCAALSASGLAAGRYFLEVTPLERSDTPIPYRPVVTITAP